MDIRFNNTIPQDAQEFLSFVLERLNERRVGDGKSVEEKCAGQIKSTMCCSVCPNTSPADEEFFNCLSIQIGSVPYQLITDCLEAYLADEEIPETTGWRCGNCCAVRSGKKKFAVVNAPKLLLIHLKRFTFVDGRMSKKETMIGIGQKLQMAGMQYRLTGIVRHR